MTKKLNKNLNIFSKTISFSDNSILPIVFGEHDKFLKIIESKLFVSIFPRGNFLKVSGEVNKVKITCSLLKTLFENVVDNFANFKLISLNLSFSISSNPY